jgi:hypothetical protein
LVYYEIPLSDKEKIMKKFDNFDRESNEFKEINLSIKILEV